MRDKYIIVLEAEDSVEVLADYLQITDGILYAMTTETISGSASAHVPNSTEVKKTEVVAAFALGKWRYYQKQVPVSGTTYTVSGGGVSCNPVPFGSTFTNAESLKTVKVSGSS